jgi:hypothetical protein
MPFVSGVLGAPCLNKGIDIEAWRFSNIRRSGEIHLEMILADDFVEIKLSYDLKPMDELFSCRKQP